MELTRTQKLLIRILLIVLVVAILIGVYLFAYHLVVEHDKETPDEKVENLEESEEDTEEEAQEDMEEILYEETHIMYETGRREDLGYGEDQILDYIEKYAEIKINEIPSVKEEKDGTDVYYRGDKVSLGLGDTFDTNKDFYINGSLSVMSLFNDNYIIFKYNKEHNPKEEFIVFYYPSSMFNVEWGYSLDLNEQSLHSKNCNFREESLGGSEILWVRGLE